eukprot:SAG31_NODE_104_length_25069_cov_12.917144_20_plen_78_part_00
MVWVQAALGCIDAWILCAALFIVLGACGVLYEDEANIDKEFNDSCSSQMSKLGVCLNPFGNLHNQAVHAPTSCNFGG